MISSIFYIFIVLIIIFIYLRNGHKKISLQYWSGNKMIKKYLLYIYCLIFFLFIWEMCNRSQNTMWCHAYPRVNQDDTRVTQDDPGWHRIIPGRPRMAPEWPRMNPGLPRMTPGWPRMTQGGTGWPQGCSVWPKGEPWWHRMTPGWLIDWLVDLWTNWISDTRGGAVDLWSCFNLAGLICNKKDDFLAHKRESIVFFLQGRLTDYYCTY